MAWHVCSLQSNNIAKMSSAIKTIARVVDLTKAILFYKKGISKLLGVPIKEIDFLYNEVNASKFLGDLDKKINNATRRYYLSMLSPFRAPLLYVICRLIKPEVVVETGVKDGYSSSFILFALEMNKKGRLYSIDLPNTPGQELKDGMHTGWLVPEEFKYRWNLVRGSSQEKLPILLRELQKIDLFFHDSEHSYENMMFEFNRAWEYLKPGGYLLSDDITENKSFFDFVQDRNCKSYLKLFKLGIIIKR